ncbi:MAG: hypothetical protein K2X03_07960 [Bryobacteraceae bacterium]|nr:hypothetical protein [Bryobacteraceae bacterium]
MRTTLDLPDEIYQRVKITAIERGETMKGFVERAVRNELAQRQDRDPVKPAKRRPFPVLHLKDRTPIDITNEQTEEAILGGFSR